jgi:hypothetical protein
MGNSPPPEECPSPVYKRSTGGMACLGRRGLGSRFTGMLRTTRLICRMSNQTLTKTRPRRDERQSYRFSLVLLGNRGKLVGIWRSDGDLDLGSGNKLRYSAQKFMQYYWNETDNRHTRAAMGIQLWRHFENLAIWRKSPGIFTPTDPMSSS